jgi:two-component system chemotaxis response regulator CheB
MGACDFIIKPSGSISMDIEMLAEEIRSKIHYYHRKNTITPKQKEVIEAEELKHSEQLLSGKEYSSTYSRSVTPKVVVQKLSLDDKLSAMHKIKIVSIGISTGGPNALRAILPIFPEDFPLPILIVQHMPPGFTKEFANGLNDICKMKVQEASDNLLILPGNIYISPGDFHMTLETDTYGAKIKLDSSPHFDGHRPSVGVLFKSILAVFGIESINVIMTGMGKDGAFYINELSKRGAIALAQSESSCVVYGMPKVAIEMGGIDEIIPLDNIAQRIIELVKRKGI